MAPNHNLFSALAGCSLEDKDEIPAATNKNSHDDELIGYDDNGDTIYKWEINPFNIVELEEKFGNRPIFTREFLRYIASTKEAANSALLAQKNLHLYYSPPSKGPEFSRGLVVGIVRDNDHDDKIGVQYLSRVELHPDFQRLHRTSESVDILRDHNWIPDEDIDWLPVPFVLPLVRRDKSTYHEDIRKMDAWRDHLQHMNALWKDSKACKQVEDAILGRLKSVRITRIVCFGLGTLMIGGKDCNRELQHLLVFQLAKFLDDIYQKKGLSLPPVEIYLQDPMYQEKDRQLLRGLSGGVKFVEDPDGLLAIDQNTLVVGAFVPTAFPFMQIIADLFEAGQGPAGFLVDNIQRMCKEPGMYRSNDRLSPRGERMMEHYSKYPRPFDKEALGKELQKALGGHSRYWMESMGLWMRK